MSADTGDTAADAGAAAAAGAADAKRPRVDAAAEPAAAAPIVIFWKPGGPHGWLSNWSAHPIVDGGVTYMTAEHAFMYHKALAMGDAAAAAKVLKAKTPYAAKQVGRSIKPWDEAKWVREREGVMLGVLRKKVAQHPQLAAMLRASAPHVLAEASPFDAVWGIGCGPSAATASDPARWRGLNLLGKLWMRVRDEL